MHLVIISGASRPQPKSNTARIIDAFRKGFEEGGNSAEVFYLSDRRQWKSAADAFYGNEHILIALPLYVESIPGILLEFLSALKIKTRPGTKLAFLLQGGFPEASQSRCCEAYLETLPAQLGCEYAGTLIKGDMFGVGLVNEKEQRKMLAPFTEMGRYFANTGAFEKSVVDEFAAPEYLSERKIRFNRFMQPVFDLLKRYIVKKLGCTGKLDARPLTEGR